MNKHVRFRRNYSVKISVLAFTIIVALGISACASKDNTNTPQVDVADNNALWIATNLSSAETFLRNRDFAAASGSFSSTGNCLLSGTYTAFGSENGSCTVFQGGTVNGDVTLNFQQCRHSFSDSDLTYTGSIRWVYVFTFFADNNCSADATTQTTTATSLNIIGSLPLTPEFDDICDVEFNETSSQTSARRSGEVCGTQFSNF